MITIYKYEIMRILQKNRKIVLFNIIGFTSMVILIGLSMSYYIEKANYENIIEDSYGNRSFYKILYEARCKMNVQK